MDPSRWIERSGRTVPLLIVVVVGGVLLPRGPGTVTGAEERPDGEAGRSAAREVIRSSNEEILALYEEEDLSPLERRRRIDAIMDRVTDFEALATRAMRGLWEDVPGEERQRYVAVFSQLLRLSATRTMGRYRADRFELLEEEEGAGETAREDATREATEEASAPEDRDTGTPVLVRTLAHYGDEVIPLDYLLERRGDSYRIVNYVADGVDTARNYRRQFRRLLRQGSFAALIERLEGRVAAMESDPAPPASPGRSEPARPAAPP